MSTIADLVVSLSADIASFRAGMSEANSSLSTLRQQSSDSGAALQELSSIFESVISVEGIKRIAEFGASLLESAAQAEHMAQALGTTVEAFQSQQYAASQAGVSSDTFSRSMETLSRNIDLIASGSGGRAAKVFADLGLSVTNADGTMRSASDVLEDLAHNRIFAAQDATQKLGEVMLIMGGRTGDAALMVNALGKNFDAATAAGERFALDNGTAEAAEKIATGFENAWRATKNFLTTMTVEALTQPASPLSWVGGLMGVKPPELNQPAQAAQAKPPGPPVVDPTQEKQITSFREQYDQLLQTYQDDVNYQARLREAYQQSADAVRQLEVEHAGEEAAEKAIAAAQRDHVAISTQEIAAIYSVAAASKQASLATEEQKEATDALAKQETEHEAEVKRVMDATDGLTKKNNDLVEALGILEQQYQSGVIPTLAEYEQRAKAAQEVFGQEADKGTKEFTSGLSSDLSGLIGKLTDFSTIMQTAGKKGGESVLQQLSQDALDFNKSLEQLLIKLLVINPLLNSLGLGDQGNGKQLPTLYGGGSAGLSSTTATSTALPEFDAGLTQSSGLLQSFVAAIAEAEAALKAMATSSSSSGSGAGLGSVLSMGSGAGGGAGESAGGMGEGEGFAHGGDFTVGGSGGTDSKRVSFLASPGERVSVTPQHSSSAANDSRRGGGGGDVNVSMSISGIHSDTFRATKHQIVGDVLRAISAGRRYA